ncbi:MAG TPA: hypothetical protein VGN13_07505, partial [Solirubrobacteraceae bacterium]
AFNGSTWGSYPLASGAPRAAANTSPTVVREAGGGGANQWVYYVGEDGKVYGEAFNGSTWGHYSVAEGGALAELPGV